MYAFLLAHVKAAQLALFVAVIAILWIVEHVVLADPAGDRLRHDGTNLLFVLAALPVEMGMGGLCLFASQSAAAQGIGFYGPLARAVGPWLGGVCVFVALDFFDYAYHRLMHHVPSLWQFHLVHHTDTAVDASTTIREHPGETLIRGGFLIVWTVLLGAPFEVLLLRQAAESIAAILSHSAVRLPERANRWLGLVFITPNLHHVHHHCERPYTDSNFGGVFSVWDRLFGTYAELEECETVFGLDTHKGIATASFGELMAMPFRDADGQNVPVEDALGRCARYVEQRS